MTLFVAVNSKFFSVRAHLFRIVFHLEQIPAEITARTGEITACISEYNDRSFISGFFGVDRAGSPVRDDLKGAT